MSMPRKKLAKQRSSIRRDSSLLSEAAAPFLGFIYPPLFDRPASLSSAPPPCLSRTGAWRCVSWLITADVGEGREAL